MPLSIPGTFFGPAVYGWFRKDKCLYIGSSKQLLQRLGLHGLINHTKKVESTDEIKVWCVGSEEEARHIEKDMIGRFNPKYNTNSRATYGKAKELRERMLELHNEGFSYNKIGKMFGFCQATVWKVCTNLGENTLSRGPYKKNTKRKKTEKTLARKKKYDELYEKVMLTSD